MTFLGATKQDVLFLKLLTFLGVLLTKTCYCSRLYGICISQVSLLRVHHVASWIASPPQPTHNMARSAGQTYSTSHNNSTMQAFTDNNNAAVRAEKDIRDLIDGRDESEMKCGKN